MIRLTLASVLISFLALTALTLWHHGYIGIFTTHLTSYAGIQVFTDLVIALSFLIVWLWIDTQKYQRNPWPWIIGTMTTGSIAPLVYLLMYKSRSDNNQPETITH